MHSVFTGAMPISQTCDRWKGFCFIAAMLLLLTIVYSFEPGHVERITQMARTFAMQDSSIYYDVPDESPVTYYCDNKICPFFKKDHLEIRNLHCAEILSGDKYAIAQAKIIDFDVNKVIPSDKKLAHLASNCSILRSRGYIPSPLTREENSFPLAFDILLHENAGEAERLLRLIYRPQNVYCVHVDAKAPASVLHAMHAVASCFDNVFIASKLEIITYGGFSRLKADINCMDDLLREHGTFPWKYFINLVSTDLPLKTNKEIVDILKIYNGANDIAGSNITGKLNIIRRTLTKFTATRDEIVNTHKKHPPPPHGLRPSQLRGRCSKPTRRPAETRRRPTSEASGSWRSAAWTPTEVFLRGSS